MTEPAPTPPPPRKRRLPILARHAISLAVVFALAIPASYYVSQRVYRHQQLRKLEDPDRQAFEQGLGYVYRHAGRGVGPPEQTARLLRDLSPDRAPELYLTLIYGAIKADDNERAKAVAIEFAPVLFKRLPADQAGRLYDTVGETGIADDRLSAALVTAVLDTDQAQPFLRGVDLLEARLLWSKDGVPRDKWIRWLTLLAAAPSEVSQLKAARLLGELPDDLADPRIGRALEQLAQSKHAAVRSQVLFAAAGYAAIADDPTDYEQIIFTLGNDTDQTIARRAWLIVGHLNPLSGYAVNWKQADPFVAEAMLWAAVKTNPENSGPAVEAILNGGLVRQGLLAIQDAEGINLIKLDVDLGAGDLIGQGGTDEPDFLAAWRAVLAIDPFEGDREYWVVSLNQLGKFDPFPLWTDEQQAEYGVGFRSRFFAMTYRFNEYYPPQGILLTAGDHELGELAAIEGRVLSTPHSPNPIVPPNTPFAQLIAGVTGTLRPSQDLHDLLDQFSLDNPALCDLLTLAVSNTNEKMRSSLVRSNEKDTSLIAVLAIALTGDKPTLVTGVTADFLREHPDLSSDDLNEMSDAELADLGLQRVDALTALLNAADAAPASAGRQPEIKMLKLALWMRGDLGDEFTPKAEAMLFDKDLPTSTVLMCLLHMQRPIALEYLFGDRVTPRPDLHELFIQQRWWHVFRRFVDTSDLTLWLWGDRAAQDFQIEAMRQWYAVNRWRIDRGGWPAPAGSKIE